MPPRVPKIKGLDRQTGRQTDKQTEGQQSDSRVPFFIFKVRNPTKATTGKRHWKYFKYVDYATPEMKTNLATLFTSKSVNPFTWLAPLHEYTHINKSHTFKILSSFGCSQVKRHNLKDALKFVNMLFVHNERLYNLRQIVHVHYLNNIILRDESSDVYR